MEFIIYLVAIFIVILNYSQRKKLVSAFNIVMLPYVVILFLNNRFLVKYNFIKINDGTCLMILVGIISFYVGNLLIGSIKKSNNVEIYTPLLSMNNMNSIYLYVLFVIIARFFELLVKLIKYGVEGLIADDFELLISKGIVGHLLISAFPLIPIMFFYWLSHKEQKKYLIIPFIFLILAFIETEKAQSISIIIAIFMYCVFINERYLRAGWIIVGIIIIVMFAGNYMLKFLIGGFFSNVSNSYYITRLWTYIAGGLINSNLVIDNSSCIEMNGFDYLFHVLSAFPNMFIGALSDFRLGCDIFANFPFIGDFPFVTTIKKGFLAQESNVISTMTFIFSNGNYLLYSLVCIIWGGICEFVMQKMIRRKNEFTIAFTCCFMTFSMLSFFGSYYSSASFIERLIYASFIPILIRTKPFKFILNTNVIR